jgi:hypothetical protein
MWFNLTTAQWLRRCGYFRYTSGIFFFVLARGFVMYGVLNIVREILSNFKRAFKVFSKKNRLDTEILWLMIIDQ